MAGQDEHDGSDAATEAFEAMRGELALLRRAVERLATERADAPEQPDYSETLGRMFNNITVIAQRVDILAKSPALPVTPDQMGHQIATVASSARREDHNMLAQARTAFDQATRELVGVVRSARRGDEQNLWLAGSGLGGVVLGLALWAALAGPIARAMPESWHWPEQRAARALDRSMWDSARRLAGVSKPEAWNEMVAGAVIGQGNQAALERCEKAAAKAGVPVRCTVRIGPGR